MRYKAKPAIVDAFQLDEDPERTAPLWFMKLVEKQTAFIDRCLNDGTMRVYGCTVYTQDKKVKAKVGDYIIREKSGEIRTCKPSVFKSNYEKAEE